MEMASSIEKWLPLGLHSIFATTFYWTPSGTWRLSGGWLGSGLRAAGAGSLISASRPPGL